MFGVLAFLEFNKIGLYLVPPFGATLSILLLVVVLPFTVIAVCSAAVLSRLVERWPSYPNPLGEKERYARRHDAEFAYRVITKRSFEG
jgi:hypothetical protein